MTLPTTPFLSAPSLSATTAPDTPAGAAPHRVDQSSRPPTTPFLAAAPGPGVTTLPSAQGTPAPRPAINPFLAPAATTTPVADSLVDRPGGAR